MPFFDFELLLSSWSKAKCSCSAPLPEGIYTTLCSDNVCMSTLSCSPDLFHACWFCLRVHFGRNTFALFIAYFCWFDLLLFLRAFIIYIQDIITTKEHLDLYETAFGIWYWRKTKPLFNKEKKLTSVCVCIYICIYTYIYSSKWITFKCSHQPKVLCVNTVELTKAQVALASIWMLPEWLSFGIVSAGSRPFTNYWELGKLAVFRL